MLRTELDALPAAELLDMPIDTEVEMGWARHVWKPVWIQAVEQWFDDGGAMYDYMVGGFKGWAARTDFEIYCDLRFTYFGDEELEADNDKRMPLMAKRWCELLDECIEADKSS